MTFKKAYQCSDWIGYLSRADVDLLGECARKLPDNPVVINIGAGVGTSGLTFMESRPDLILYSIDVNDFPNPYGGLVNEKNAFVDAGFWGDPRHHQIHGDSKRVGEAWTGGPVDMVFIDGEHTETQIVGDIESWLPHIKDDGIIIFHDYYNPQYLMITIVGRYFREEAAIGETPNCRAFVVKKDQNA
jgi:predicted O-methyltransferase YrrM